MSQADELLKYKALLESGAITQEEYDAAKAKILGNLTPTPTNTSMQQNYQFGNNSYENVSYENSNSRLNNQSTVNDMGVNFRPRQGMRIAGIICVVFALIYLMLVVSAGLFMIAMAAFLGILAFMFFKLSKVPKTYMHIGKADTGMRKDLFVILCVLIAFLIPGVASKTIVRGNSNSNTDTNNTVETAKADSTDTEEKEVVAELTETEPTVAFANDFEKALYYAISNNNGIVTNIYLEEASDSNNQTSSEYVEFYCENSEAVVQGILDKLVETQKADGTYAVCAVVKESEDSTSNLVIADIDKAGNLSMTFESPNYNSARNSWISGQFSTWDGSHIELTKRIKQSLNDEKSYAHISTVYRDIKTQEDADEINTILSDTKYSSRVEIGDLFIMTEFSAKNGFNATVKSVAYGITRYSNNSITLLGIE